jgi:predicted NACHT family NTPase
MWDVNSGICLQTFEGHYHWVRSVALSQDSSRVASGSTDTTVKIWDANSGVCLRTFEGHYHWVNSVAFSQDSSLVASGSSDTTVRIWDANSGACLRTFEGHYHWVNSVALSQDSSRVASGSSDKTVKIWDAKSGACLQTFYSDRDIDSLSFDITGSYLYTNTGTIVLDSSALSDLIGSFPQDPEKRRDLHEPQKPQYRGYGSGDVWITRNSKDWLWLPPEYRSKSSAVAQSMSTLALGSNSGRVLIFGFSTEE